MCWLYKYSFVTSPRGPLPSLSLPQNLPTQALPLFESPVQLMSTHQLCLFLQEAFLDYLAYIAHLETLLWALWSNSM